MKRYLALILVTVLVFGKSESCFAALSESGIKAVKVKTEGLNVRSGPGIEYEIIGEALKDEVLQVYGTEKNWYLVGLKNGSYGMVYYEYAEPVQFEAVELEQGAADEVELTDTEKLFSLINETRVKNGLEAFEWNEKLNNIALKKCEDMLENKYFAHDSPVYGTPFKMLKHFEIEYNGATENLAKTSSVEAAFEQIMASPSHRSNVLSKRYNNIGVAVVEHSKYYKLVVQIFVDM